MCLETSVSKCFDGTGVCRGILTGILKQITGKNQGQKNSSFRKITENVCSTTCAF
jgi:hypothetical protein